MESYLKSFFIITSMLIFVYLQKTGITEAAGDKCVLPGGARGECVALPACLQYVALLKESTTTELGLKLTQERRCGFEENNIMVCCPTVTELSTREEVEEKVPDLKIENNTDDSDYVDELPAPLNCGKKPFGVDNIINGTKVIRREMAEWMALLGYRRSPSTWECGGSIITKRHVLTAAHCIRESLYVVRVGELDLAKTENDFEPMDFYIKKKIRHEQYTQYHNDIGILILNGIIPIEDWQKPVAPVCLPEPGFPYEKQGPSDPFITGWGESGKNRERPTNLMYAFIDIMDQDACKRTYSAEGLTIDERVFCAGDPSTKHDACNGDSGGPLVASYYLPDYEYFKFYYQLGLISYGYRCSAERYIGVYTNITTFMPWILEKVTGKPGPRLWTTTANPIFFLFDYDQNNSDSD